MLRPLPSNPLLDQTLRAGRWPSPRIALVLLIALLAGAAAGRAWLVDHTPAEARAVLLLLLWLLPLVTMAVAAVSTARRLCTESFQLIKQSPLTDRQVTWGLGLGTFYSLRLVLVIAFGLLPALVDDTPLGGASTALCLAGLHLAASMLGTVLVLGWGRQRLGMVLAAIVCTLTVALLPTLITFLTPIVAPSCPSTSLHPIHFRLSALLLGMGLHGPLPLVAATVLPALVGLAANLIPWQAREVGWRSRLETMGLVIAVGLAFGLWLFDASQVEVRERQALAALYRTTNGNGWMFRDGWLSDRPICSWYGVTCTCRRVVGLSIGDIYGGNRMQGRLPPEIGKLTDLKTLELPNNQLTELSPEIGQLIGLQTLDLRGNHLTKLPQEIRQLTNLQTLELSYNHLATLPPEIGQLTSLEALDLESNNLALLLPEIGQLADLHTLDLRGNHLTKLPPEFWRLISLQWLYLSDNQFTELPPEIGQLTSLHVLDLSDNQFTELPPEIGQLTSLEWLYLSDNQLTELPPEIGQLTYLWKLYPDGNPLSVLPPEICQKPGLEINAEYLPGRDIHIREKLCNK